MITYKMHLIRTGGTSSGQGKRFVGRLDIPLCENGIDTLCEMRENFIYPRVDAVFTSPLKRCLETSEILYPNSYTVEIDGLADMDLGEFEGKSFEELRGNESFLRWIDNSLENPPPGGETLSDFTARILDAIREVFATMMDERITNAAVITHSGVIMTLLSAIGLPQAPLHKWGVENGGGYTLLFTPQMWMRDGAAEVFRRLPEAPSAEIPADYGIYGCED